MLALFGWHWADAAALRVQQRQQSTWHEVSAVLLANGRPVVDIGYGGVAGSEVPARWTAPDGSARTGDVPAPVSARAGRTVRIWVDHTGALTGPPLRAEQAAGQAMLTSVLAPLDPGRRAHLRHLSGGARPGPAPSGGLGGRLAGHRATLEQPPLSQRSAGAPGQAGTGMPVIASLTTTTGHGACRRQARATGPMPSGAQRVALPSTSRSAPAA